jgi:hypothetical protein
LRDRFPVLLYYKFAVKQFDFTISTEAISVILLVTLLFMFMFVRFVLLKERNMLLTMEHECKEQAELFPNPERIDKVSTCSVPDSVWLGLQSFFLCLFAATAAKG